LAASAAAAISASLRPARSATSPSRKRTFRRPRSRARAPLTIDGALNEAAWRDAPYFSEAERAALALTEAATRLADRPDAVSDDVWIEAARHLPPVLSVEVAEWQ